MKVKRLREDFVVREITQFPLSGGHFSTYVLEKNGLGTPEAIQEIIKVWNLPRNQISYGGLKDRHAITSQTITIFRGPERDITQRSFSLQYLGKAPREFGAKDISANEFEVTLRGLQADKVEALQQSASESAAGIPNYFDDQRFGSVGVSGEFVGHPWCLGNYERALFLAIADANSHDRPREREQKELLRKHWGNWLECKRVLDRSHRRSIVTYLCDHPTDFRRALALVRIDLRSIYVAAFQSQLWNQVVAAWWRKQLPADQWIKVPGAGSELVFPTGMSPDLASTARRLQIPLPSARQKEWDPEIGALLDEVLTAYSMQRHEIRLKYPRDTFFSKGTREVLLVPRNLTFKSAVDETAGRDDRFKLKLVFSLNRGQYATMLVKFLDTISGIEVEPATESSEDTQSDPVESLPDSDPMNNAD
jgi:tRNA pseudouridine13 synthase